MVTASADTLSLNFGHPVPTPFEWVHGDFDASGTVDLSDFAQLVAHWQQQVVP